LELQHLERVAGADSLRLLPGDESGGEAVEHLVDAVAELAGQVKGPAGRTEGPVIFSVVPPSATVSENGRALGAASAFGPASPLKLSGPMVHDLEIAAPGFESRVVRILVSSNADRPQAVVTLALKPLPAASN